MNPNHHTVMILIEQRLRDDRERARRDHLAARDVAGIRTLLARRLMRWALRLEPALESDIPGATTLSGA